MTNAEVSLWIGSGALGELQPFSLREARLPPIDVDSGSYLMLSLEASHEYRNVAWTPLRLSGYTGKRILGISSRLNLWIGSMIMPSRAHTPGLRDGSPAYYSKQVSPWEVASRATLGHAGVSGVWLSGGHFGYKYPLALVVLYTHVAGTSVCSYLH